MPGTAGGVVEGVVVGTTGVEEGTPVALVLGTVEAGVTTDPVAGFTTAPEFVPTFAGPEEIETSCPWPLYIMPAGASPPPVPDPVDPDPEAKGTVLSEFWGCTYGRLMAAGVVAGTTGVAGAT